MRLKLKTTADQWHSLAVAVDKVRDGSKFVKVDKVALDALMKDHSAMVGELHLEAA